MKFLKKIFALTFLSIFMVNILCVDVMAQRASSRNSRGSRSKRSATSRGAVARPAAVTAVAAPVTQSTTIWSPEETQPTTDIAAPVAQSTTVIEAPDTSVVASVTESTEVALTDEQILQQVQADENWDDFKFCMMQSCSGGSDQPPNVECYKKFGFDSAFQNCKLLIKDPSKYEKFSKYFQTIYIPIEKEEACKNTYSGRWDGNRFECYLDITFKRYYKTKAKKSLRNDEVGCNDTRVKTFAVGGKSTSCLYETFGLGPCYSDNPQQLANEVALGIGIATTVVGGLTGAIGAISAISSVKGEAKYDDDGKATGQHESLTYSAEEAAAYNSSETDRTKHKSVDDKKKGVVGQQWAAGLSGGLSAGMGMISDGVSNIVSAKVMSKQVGPEVQGRCTFPDATTVREGAPIDLSW